ncbi:hypothetical protein BGW39_000251 [Mortierella sp. 14UC]|nr:hypothetical protein BGW39_000251 [Mortierella sp. 14UC]
MSPSHSQKKTYRVNILGAGVSGLSTALALLEKKNYFVKIYATHLPSDLNIDYTSPWAGAHWRSYADIADLAQQELDTATFNRLAHLADTDPKAGVMYLTGHDFWDVKPKNFEDPWFKRLVKNVAILLKDITFILDGNPTKIASKANLPAQPAPSPSPAPTPDTSLACISAPLPNSDPTSTPPTTSSSSAPPKDTGALLVNFDKFRRLTQYVENAVDMAKSVDYSFEHQLLHQARVFRPSSPSLNGGESESLHGHGHGHGGGGSSLLGGFGNSSSSSSSNGPAPDGSRGALDHISEMVERRLVKASGLYGVHQRVIQVEFVNRAPSSKSSGGTSSLWKSSVGDSGAGSVNGNTHGSTIGGGGGIGSDMVIRAVQGEEDYLIGLSRMCEPARW